MFARSIGSSTLSFGLVAIPVKLYTATSDCGVSFATLHKECGERVVQQLYCPKHEQVIERDDTAKGYELVRGEYVPFTGEELRLLDAEGENAIELDSFVPAASVDPLYVCKTQFLGPDKGGHKAYALLAEALRKRKIVAVGRSRARGQSHVALVRPYDNGLALHRLFYSNEVRAFSDVELGPEQQLSREEQRLIGTLIDQLSAEAFDPKRYVDDYADRVRAAAELKVAGGELARASEEQPRIAQVVDLHEALKRSIQIGRAIKGPKKVEPQDDERKVSGRARLTR